MGCQCHASLQIMPTVIREEQQMLGVVQSQA